MFKKLWKFIVNLLISIIDLEGLDFIYDKIVLIA